MADETPQADQTTGGRSRVMEGVIALIVLAGIGVGGYAVGHKAADANGHFNDGLSKGKAAYASGTPGYQAIYRAGAAAGNKTGKKTGLAQGTKVGFEKGTKQGKLKGEQVGIQSGSAEALGNFGSWTPGNFYIVKVAAGTAPGVAYTVDSRKPLDPGQLYSICANDSNFICSRPVPPKG